MSPLQARIMAHLRASDDPQTVSDVARAVPGTQDWHRHRETVRRSCRRLHRNGYVGMQMDDERGPYPGLGAWVVWARQDVGATHGRGA